MSDTNSKKKPTDQLTPVKTYIRIEGNDGDDDEMALMSAYAANNRARRDVGEASQADG